MSISTNSPTFLPDFAGRRLSVCVWALAALGSASLNVYGATQIFPALYASVCFGVVILACEVIAATSLRHIVTDRDNNRYWKARAASAILLLAIVGCVISGKTAFNVLFLEANANHQALTIRADARQAEADAYHAQMLAGQLDISKDKAQARWETKQGYADTARLAQLKSRPPHEAIVFVLLALFEAVKIGGLWAVATPSTKGLTHRQRRALKRREAIAEAEAEAKHELALSNVTPFRKEA